MQLQVATLVLCLRCATGLHARPAVLLSPRRVSSVRNVAPLCADGDSDSEELAKARRRRDEQALQSEWGDGLSKNAQVLDPEGSLRAPPTSTCAHALANPNPTRRALLLLLLYYCYYYYYYSGARRCAAGGRAEHAAPTDRPHRDKGGAPCPNECISSRARASTGAVGDEVVSSQPMG